MATEIGESSASINARDDREAIGNIMAGLNAGGRLQIHRKIGRVVLEGLPESHPTMHYKARKTITMSRARRLLKEGVIFQSGIDQYMLAPEQIMEGQ